MSNLSMCAGRCGEQLIKIECALAIKGSGSGHQLRKPSGTPFENPVSSTPVNLQNEPDSIHKFGRLWLHL